jgi:hypothetical protein
MSLKFQHQLCPTDYYPAENSGELDIVVHKNVRLSEVIVSDILGSEHLPVVFHLLNHIRTKNLLDLVDKFTDWERFQSLASQIWSLKIQINSGEEANKAVCNFTASLALA